MCQLVEVDQNSLIWNELISSSSSTKTTNKKSLNQVARDHDELCMNDYCTFDPFDYVRGEWMFNVTEWHIMTIGRLSESGQTEEEEEAPCHNTQVNCGEATQLIERFVSRPRVLIHIDTYVYIYCTQMRSIPPITCTNSDMRMQFSLPKRTIPIN